MFVFLIFYLLITMVQKFMLCSIQLFLQFQVRPRQCKVLNSERPGKIIFLKCWNGFLNVNLVEVFFWLFKSLYLFVFCPLFFWQNNLVAAQLHCTNKAKGTIINDFLRKTTKSLLDFWSLIQTIVVPQTWQSVLLLSFKKDKHSSYYCQK